MLIVLPILLVAVLAGYALGGRLRRVADARIRLWPLAILGLMLQAAPPPEVGGRLGEMLPTAMLLVSFALLMLVCLANWRVRGFGLILIGLAMNFAVIAANQGMPVSAEALRRAGDEESIERLRGATGKHHLATEESMLRPLGDVIGVPPPVRAAISVGDIIAYLGAAVFVAAAMKGAAMRRPLPRHRAGPATTTEMWH